MLLKSLLLCPDPDAVDVLRRVLEELDIHVESCPESALGPARFSKDRFEAVIVDCENLPVGLQMLKKARGSPLNGEALMVALVTQQEFVREVFAAGASFVLYKPISMERARTSLQAARGLMRRERRRSGRLPVNASVGLSYANVEDVRATLVDLSETGSGVQCEHQLPAGNRLYFQFTLPGHSDVIRLAGDVAWQDKSGRLGVRFAHVPQASARQLKQWLRNNEFRQAEMPAPAFTPAAKYNQSETVEASSAADAGLARFRPLPGNRRGQSRHACLLGAEVYRSGTVVPHRCQLSDISIGGCYVEMPTPFSAETRVEIVVRTRDLKISTEGVVQSVHPGFGMGVKFSPRNDAERGQVQQLISLLHSQQALEPWA
ncbi:MAG TPA: PilZ domain-containing protein [Terriglobales bacterium]|nr:PilZ domain-containing protein [Terriglobales bacterium]